MMKVVKISAKEMNEKHSGPCGGYITGAHYALYEEGKGFYSSDGKRTYILKGNTGKKALQAILDAGGLIGAVQYLPTI